MLEMRLMLRTMLSDLHPSVPRGSVWRRGEWTRRRAITLVPAGGTRVVWITARLSHRSVGPRPEAVSNLPANGHSR